jgi:hypothetical protein
MGSAPQSPPNWRAFFILNKLNIFLKYHAGGRPNGIGPAPATPAGCYK